MRNLIYLMVAGIFLTSCSRERVTLPDDFEVSSTSNTYKAGDTVTLNFNGNPDNITFFSGEPGFNYEFRQRTSAMNTLRIEFKTLVQFGLIYPNLKLLVSNNFTGVADTNSIKKATWTDITSQAIFSTGADNVSSGVLDLTQYVNRDDSASRVYVAFKYADYKKPQGQNRWVVRTFNAETVSPEGTITNLATMATGGFQQVSFKNPSFVWSVTTVQLLMPSSTATADDNEDWVFTKGFDASSVKPDAGIALKNISTTLGSYKYVYKKAGTYKAVLEASNARFNGDKRLTREISFTITP